MHISKALNTNKFCSKKRRYGARIEHLRTKFDIMYLSLNRKGDETMKRVNLISAIMLTFVFAGCAHYSEMSAARDTGREYLLGRFDQQICELESLVTVHPELGYSTERIVQEVIPSQGKGENVWEMRTKYEDPMAKIRLYGKKVKFPASREGINTWIATTDENIANLKSRLMSELAEREVAKRQNERSVEAPRQDKRLAKKNDLEGIAKINAVLSETYSSLKEIAEGDQYDIDMDSEYLTDGRGTYRKRAKELLARNPVCFSFGMACVDITEFFSYSPSVSNPWQIDFVSGLSEERKRTAMSAWERWINVSDYLTAIRERQQLVADAHKAVRLLAKKKNRFDDELAQFNAKTAEVYASLKEIAEGEQYDIKRYENYHYRTNTYKSDAISALGSGPVDLRGYFDYCPTEINPWHICLNNAGENHMLAAIVEWDGHVRGHGSKWIQEKLQLVTDAKAALKREAAAKAQREAQVKKLTADIERVNELLAEEYAKIKAIAEDEQYSVSVKYSSTVTYKSEAMYKLEKFDIKDKVCCWTDLDKSLVYGVLSFSAPGSGVWHVSIKGGVGEADLVRLSKTDLYACFQRALKEVHDLGEEAIAKIAEINAKAETAKQKLANFTEAEKYPMLSAVPNNLSLMKDITSGLSRDWVETYLAANKIDFSLDQSNTDRISASVNGREITFYFEENTLCSLFIQLPAPVALDMIKTKYANGEDVAVEIEESEPEMSISPFDTLESGVVPFRKVGTVSFMTKDGMRIKGYHTAFAGLVWINASGVAGLGFALSDANTQLEYFKLDENSNADVVLDADGRVVKCNTLGKRLLSALQNRARSEREKYNGDIWAIRLTDVALLNHCCDLQNAAKAAKAKQAEEEKKKADAAILDF